MCFFRPRPKGHSQALRAWSCAMDKPTPCGSSSHALADFSRSQIGMCGWRVWVGLCQDNKTGIGGRGCGSQGCRDWRRVLTAGARPRERGPRECHSGSTHVSLCGLASLECSCCYPGNGPSGLQGLITFLKVFRSCEFWKDYINVASKEKPANKGENAAGGWQRPWNCKVMAARWEASMHLPGTWVPTA